MKRNKKEEGGGKKGRERKEKGIGYNPTLLRNKSSRGS